MEYETEKMLKKSFFTVILAKKNMGCSNPLNNVCYDYVCRHRAYDGHDC